MWEAFSHNLTDPAGAAVPFFLLFMVIEMAAIRNEEKHDRAEADAQQVKGYLREDTRTSLTMFVASIGFSAAFRTAAFLLYTVIYVHLAPWHLSADSLWTWVGVILGVDLLWYTYHRFSHRVRIGWAGHQAHHSSLFFNFSTALRQKWNQWFEVLIWLPLPLLGVPPWMIYFVFSLNLIWQFHLHTEKYRALPAVVGGGLQHPVPPPGAPRIRPDLPRPQLRRDPDPVGPDARLVPGRAAPSDVWPDLPGRDLQRVGAAVRGVPQDLARRATDDPLARQGRVRPGPPGVGAAGLTGSPGRTELEHAGEFWQNEPLRPVRTGTLSSPGRPAHRFRRPCPHAAPASHHVHTSEETPHSWQSRFA
jgi:hypothetical protein